MGQLRDRMEQDLILRRLQPSTRRARKVPSGDKVTPVQ